MRQHHRRRLYIGFSGLTVNGKLAFALGTTV